MDTNNIILNKEQAKYMEAVIWLTNPQIRREGKTFVLALAFIENAINNPGKAISIFDHTGTIMDRNNVRFIISELLPTKLSKKFRLEREYIVYEPDKLKNN